MKTHYHFAKTILPKINKRTLLKDELQHFELQSRM